MTRLEGAHAAVGIFVEQLVDIGHQHHVTRRNQATLERDDRGAGLAEQQAEHFLGHFFPAAIGDERLVLGNGQLQIVRRIEGQDRLIGGDQRLGGGCVAILVGITQHIAAIHHVEDGFLTTNHCGKRQGCPCHGRVPEKRTSIQPHIVT
ncbi:hypothetical protein D9M68_838950 [compost metagenome]